MIDPTTEPTDPVPAPAATSSLHRLRLIIWAVVLVVLAVFAFFWLRPATSGEVTQRPAQGAFTLGGPFTLTGADGKSFSSAKLAGQPYVMFFGFTHCPDVCPNTLARLVRLRTQLGKGETPFQIVFVSVDPERDTPEAVGSYAKLFNSPIIGLTGTRAQVDQVAKQHAVYEAKVADSSAPDGYTMDHSAAALLFGRDGKFVATIAQEEGDDTALAKLKRITS
ncbi:MULTISPECIES: SCO family protein [Sphingomonas]|uniref:SCO family protein n=1 Tax=Sphingomonas TaxID=13687 RepID=UPI000DEFFFD4|nr:MULTISPECIES: SCO family protein [Sphingomonas]